MSDYLLTEEEIQQVVDAYIDEASWHRISLNRGHYEVLLSLIAEAQLAKVYKLLETP